MNENPTVQGLPSIHDKDGYWLPFTMVVVLQPDYGSTRQRAAQRVLGTLAGSLAASVLLWVKPPLPVAAQATPSPVARRAVATSSVVVVGNV